MSDSSEARFKIEVGGRSYGKYTVTLVAGDEIVDRDKVDLDNEEKREGLIAKWTKKHAGLCPDGLREVLLKKLAEVSRDPPGAQNEQTGQLTPEQLLEQMPQKALNDAEELLAGPDLVFKS